jgi:hypothetical protein
MKSSFAKWTWLQAAFPWFRKGSHVKSDMWLGDVDHLWRVLIEVSASATA